MKAAPIALYAMPGALYSAKVRTYLRKQRIPFEERCPGDERFSKEILPVTQRWIIPVLQTPSGEIIQDGAVILDHFEAQGVTGPSASPADPFLNVIAHIFELFGGEGLVRPAMHYRWNFDADNLDFLRADFVNALAPGASEEVCAATFAMSSGLMRKAARALGVSPATIPAIEASYLDFLSRFEAHLAQSPYVLGMTPTWADYGLIGPLHPHLSRDPYPATLMKRVAPRVLRWVERMNAADADAGEYLGKPPAWLVPETSASLLSLMRFIAEDYLPELEAHVSYANAWLDARPDLEAGTNGLPKPGDRNIGRTQFTWRGVTAEIMVLPYRLFMLQRVQDAAAKLDAAGTVRLRALLSGCGLLPLLDLQCRRRVERRGQVEVWGPLQNGT
jgi:glutathione S-transferase